MITFFIFSFVLQYFEVVISDRAKFANAFKHLDHKSSRNL